MNPALIQHFKLSENDLVQIKNSLQPHQTALDVIFEKKLIDQSAYLEWAKEHYSLPVLKTAFLEQNNNVSALLDRYKNVFPKNVIPFHEMDGVLYVMCLEPTPFEAPQPVQYVLAPYNVIAEYAIQNETSIVKKEVVEAPTTVKEETNPLFKDLSSAKEGSPLDSFSFDNLTLGENSDAPTSESPNIEDVGEIKLEDKQDIPAGLSFPTLPKDENSAVTENPVTAVDLNSFKFDGIAPVVESETPKSDTATQPSPPANEPVNPPQAAPVASQPTQPLQPIPPEPVAAPQVAPPTPMAATQPVAQPAAAGTKNMTSFSVNDLVAKPKAKPAASQNPAPPQPATPQAQVSPPPVTPSPPQSSTVTPTPQPSASTNAAAQFEGILNSMTKYFEKSMVLIFKGVTLEPHARTPNWTKAPHSQGAIDVSTPSIFRIVNETHKPYHGHIVPNHINEAFFNTWNSGQIPEHVTICPIVHEKKLFGMILGSTTKDGGKKFQLHHIQEIANDAFAMMSSNKAA